MKKPRAPKIRAALHSIISKLPSGGLGTEDIVKRLRKEHAQLVDEEINDVIEAGLMRLAGDALQRRTGATTSTQIELFAEYRIPRTYTIRVRTPKGSKSIHKKLADMTLADAMAFVEQHSVVPINYKPDVAEVSRLIEFVKAHGAALTDMLVTAWQEAKKPT